MAERLIEGKDILLWIKRTTDAEYLLVACLQSNDFSGTTATTDSSSKCGDTSTPGTRSSSISITGQVLLSPEIDDDTQTGVNSGLQKTSAPDLYELWANSDTFDWYMGRVKTQEDEGDWSLNGSGYLSAFGWTNPNGDKSQFSATLTNTETPESIVISAAS